MLDQNTDRMWYVIGAVLIGAAIIFGMNTLMPEAFASVGDMFTSLTEMVDTNPIHRYIEPYATGKGLSSTLVRQGNDYILSSNGERHAGIQIDNQAFIYGEYNEISFTIEHIEGQVDTIGGHLSYFSDLEVYIDGRYVTDTWAEANVPIFQNGVKSHNVSVRFRPLVERGSDANSHFHIQPNRKTNTTHVYGEPYKVYIKDISVGVVK